MSKKDANYAEAQMLIRKPAAIVFDAFVDPAITTQFWFTKASGKLEPGKRTVWTWEMYNVSTTVHVIEMEKNEKLVFEWGEPARLVTFLFKNFIDDSTYVTVTETGFTQSGDELIAAIRGSTGGFTTVLDGLKAFLEFGINLNLIADKFPAGK